MNESVSNQGSGPSEGHSTTSTGVDPTLQREIDEALGGQSVDDLVERSLTEQKPEAGAGDRGGQTAAAESDSADKPATGGAQHPSEFHHEIRRGRVAAIRGDDVFVELTGDSKHQGLVPLTQFDRPPRIGSIMDFVVDRIDEGEGLIYLSREGAVSRATWQQLERGAVVEARVTGTNKGGLELEMIGGISAFMPASQIDLHHVRDLESFVGQKLEAMVQEIDRKSKKVVLNRRELLHQRREQARQKVMAELAPGQIREGKVTSLVEFGAFVDLGGVDGLIHVSDLSYTHVDKPADVVKVGQTVNVKVLKIDPERQRISLGLKQVEPDPWQTIAERVHVGDDVTGRVIRTANFGAFVEIEPGIEGLLPLSEMSWKRIGKAEEVVSVGEVLRLKVLSLDAKKHRISLSLKQSQGDPWVGAERKYEQNSWIEGRVVSTPDFGAFVEVEPGVEGLVHISELSDGRVDTVQDVVNVGDVKRFRVLEVDEPERKMRLTLRREPSHADGQDRGDRRRHHGPAPKPAARRQPRGDLKGGMDVGGIGLGGLRLEDIQ